MFHLLYACKDRVKYSKYRECNVGRRKKNKREVRYTIVEKRKRENCKREENKKKLQNCILIREEKFLNLNM